MKSESVKTSVKLSKRNNVIYIESGEENTDKLDTVVTSSLPEVKLNHVTNDLRIEELYEIVLGRFREACISQESEFAPLVFKLYLSVVPDKNSLLLLQKTLNYLKDTKRLNVYVYFITKPNSIMGSILFGMFESEKATIVLEDPLPEKH